MCTYGNLELLQHVSQKLTEEQMSILISQQSPIYRNTVCTRRKIAGTLSLIPFAAHHARC